MQSLLRLIFWGALWLMAWGFTTLLRRLTRKPRLDNCLTWALRRWDSDDGYLVIRWCRSAQFRWMRWPHFLWLPLHANSELCHFLPRDDNDDLHVLPAPWFEGKIVKGDSSEHIEN